MKVTCPMCDGDSILGSKSEIVLDCDWCGGRGWIDESENLFYADEEFETEYEEQASPAWCSGSASKSGVC